MGSVAEARSRIACDLGSDLKARHSLERWIDCRVLLKFRDLPEMSQRSPPVAVAQHLRLLVLFQELHLEPRFHLRRLVDAYEEFLHVLVGAERLTWHSSALMGSGAGHGRSF